jgi:hypothetical protein
MEKQPNLRQTFRRTGLLSFLCVLALPLSGQQPVPLNGLSITPEQNRFYADRPITYMLTIPGASPVEVQATLPPLPDGVVLETLRKEGRIEAGQPMTVLRFAFRTSATGPLRLPALAVRVAGGPVVPVPFEETLVVQDPLLARPLVFLRPDNPGPARLGEPFYVTLYGRNIAAITGLTLDLRKDAAFSQVSWGALASQETQASQEAQVLETGAGLEDSLTADVPLARLEWLPLETGVLPLPGVHLTVTTFAGEAVRVSPPVLQVAVEALPGAVPEPAAALPYPHAFDDPSLPTDDVPAFATDPAAAVQEAMQSAVQCAAGEARRSFVLFLALCGAAVLLGAAAALAVRKRASRGAALASVLLAAAVFGLVRTGIPLTQTRGVFAGGGVKAVPEMSASTVGTLLPGALVRVLKQSDRWYLVSQNALRGWVLAESVYLMPSLSKIFITPHRAAEARGRFRLASRKSGNPQTLRKPPFPSAP